ncbi:hypothetical protein ACA910_009404 [Epithemia clementina (nom. ined.)]
MPQSASWTLFYASVAGRSIELNTGDFPDFSVAIDHNVNDKNGTCSQTLTVKAKDDFQSGRPGEYNARQSYLRITTGINQGDSPGIPYVIEIWPPGCYSPIHDHAQCNAIFKVLHGSLNIRYYSGLNTHRFEPYGQAVVAAGDVTLLDDRQFQTHQLYNLTACLVFFSILRLPFDFTSVTIQCYLYNDHDHKHYENVDYIGGDKQICPFVPNSDWGFGTFKILIRSEWDAYLKRAVPKPEWLPLS